MQFKKEQCFPVCHNTLICGFEGPAIGRHMIKALPHPILPPEIIRVSFSRFSSHRVISPFLETMHSHHVRRTRLRLVVSSLRAIPKTERRMDIDDVVFGSYLPHIFRDSSRKLDRAEAIRPRLRRQEVFKKKRFHAVPQVAQFPREIVDNSCDPGLGLSRHTRYHQNSHLRLASLCRLANITGNHCSAAAVRCSVKVTVLTQSGQCNQFGLEESGCDSARNTHRRLPSLLSNAHSRR